MKEAMALLADPSPALRLRVVRDLLGRPETDPEVVELRALRESDPLITSLLEVQEPDGSWRSRQLPGVSGDDLWATSVALSRLAYAGLDRDHWAVRRGAEFLFARQLPNGSWPLFATHDVDQSRVDDGYDEISLQTSMPLRGLAACGYGSDPRAERAYEWLLARRLEDGAWPTGVAAGNFGYVAGYRGLIHSRWGCRTNTTAALICLAHHPRRRREAAARRAVELLLGEERRERRHVGVEVARLVGMEGVTGRFTYFARFDPALLLDLCRRIGATLADPGVADLADFVRGLAGPYGLWTYEPNPAASRWLSYDLRRSLSHLDGDGERRSSEPGTPFTRRPST